MHQVAVVRPVISALRLEALAAMLPRQALPIPGVQPTHWTVT